jgi:Kef-type K+ transport system membrane component KefB
MRIPAVVLEIVAGIVVGPSVLGWVEVDLPVSP